jgi:hypothetical protein
VKLLRLLTVPLLVGALVPVYALPAGADSEGLDLLVPFVAPMLPGQQGWVSALWQADDDVCNVQVTATGTGLTFSYPSNTATFSSLYTSNGLAKGNLDYTAFDVAVGAAVTSPVKVTLKVSYQELPSNVINKNDDLKTKKFTCTGTRNTATATATLPVTASLGAAVVQKTTAINVPRNTVTWANITFRGNRPGLDNFRVTLTPPAGLGISYPGDATSAGLSGTPTLPVGEDDYVAVRFDASKITLGVYVIPVKATYSGGSFTGALTVTVT